MKELDIENDILDADTIHSGQYDNLKYDDGEFRVWVSRMTVDDGMEYNRQVTVEKLVNGRWETEQEINSAFVTTVFLE